MQFPQPVLAGALLLSGCAHTHQDVLRNQPPEVALSKTLEIYSAMGGGYGAPISGDRIVTAAHIIHGQSVYYRSISGSGRARILSMDRDTDLAILVAKEGLQSLLEVSESLPNVGEEVYWTSRLPDGTTTWNRGWYQGKSAGWGMVNGWFHPGTSGSPLLRADGTVWGIASAGHNWSCTDNVLEFDLMSDKDKFDCLYRMAQFPSHMRVRIIVGEIR